MEDSLSHCPPPTAGRWDGILAALVCRPNVSGLRPAERCLTVFGNTAQQGTMMKSEKKNSSGARIFFRTSHVPENVISQQK
jgi:hypothetical protein